MRLRCLEKLADATIKAPVNFEFGGVTFNLTLHIRIVKEDELAKLIDPQKSTDIANVKALLVDWSDYVDEGKDVSFSSDTLDEMLAYGGIAARLSVECVQAQYRVQEKN